jgi:hypothetical protein
MGGAGAERGKEVTEEDDYKYYQAMFRNSLWWSVALVAMFALIAWLA